MFQPPHALVALACLTALPFHAPAADPVPLEQVKLNRAPLETWGERTYRYQIERNGQTQTLGTVQLSTRVEGAKVVFQERWKLQWRGKDIRLNMTVDNDAGPWLRPTRVVSEGEGDDEVAPFTATFKADHAVVKRPGKPDRQADVPPGTLTDSAMFRLFTMLPRQKGTAVRVGHVLELSEMNLKGEAVITCEGKDEINLGGKPVTLHRFTYKRGDRLVTEAWVSDQGVLRRMKIDGRKIISEVGPNVL